jgi:hypothetical protein
MSARKLEERASGKTLVMAERTAATMTTSLSFFARTAALPDGKVEVLGLVVAMLIGW